MSITRPRRRFTVDVQVSGDTWDDVKHVLVDILPHIEDHGPACNSVGGGNSSSHHVIVTEDPEQTHDRYFEQLDAYLAKTHPKSSKCPRCAGRRADPEHEGPCVECCPTPAPTAAAK